MLPTSMRAVLYIYYKCEVGIDPGQGCDLTGYNQLPSKVTLAHIHKPPDTSLHANQCAHQNIHILLQLNLSTCAPQFNSKTHQIYQQHNICQCAKVLMKMSILVCLSNPEFSTGPMALDQYFCHRIGTIPFSDGPTEKSSNILWGNRVFYRVYQRKLFCLLAFIAQTCLELFQSSYNLTHLKKILIIADMFIKTRVNLVTRQHSMP